MRCGQEPLGRLSVDFAKDLEHSPRLFAGVVRAILDANFPPTLHDDILDAVGITLEPPIELISAPIETIKRRRDPAFREQVLLAYEYRCAACGYDGQLMREAVGIDAAHVRWWAAEGPDEVANGIALCSLHQKLLDRGAIGITADRKVAVSSHFLGHGAAAESLVFALIDQPLRHPQPGQPLPHGHDIGWHTKEVFRPPARIAAS